MKQKTMIELFSGSKTVAGLFKKNAWNVITIDNNPKLKPSMCCNILSLIKETLPGNVAFIWASPDCTYFSRAAAQHHWKKETVNYRIYNYIPVTQEALTALKLIQKTVDIISWYPNAWFVIENPIGRIHHTAALKSLGHYRYSVNYADFGFPYSKETYLFSNLQLPFSTKKVSSDAPGLRTIRSKYQRSKVPALLVETIMYYLP